MYVDWHKFEDLCLQLGLHEHYDMISSFPDFSSIEPALVILHSVNHPELQENVSNLTWCFTVNPQPCHEYMMLWLLRFQLGSIYFGYADLLQSQFDILYLWRAICHPQLNYTLLETQDKYWDKETIRMFKHLNTWGYFLQEPQFDNHIIGSDSPDNSHDQ